MADKDTGLPFAAYHGGGPYAFVSYAHGDASIVYPILRRLHQLGVNIWYDEGIYPGAEWRDELAAAIGRSSAFLYFLTPRSAVAKICRSEVHFAIDSNIHFLTLLMEDFTVPPGVRFAISEHQAINTHSESFATVVDKIFAWLNQVVPVSNAPRRGLNADILRNYDIHRTLGSSGNTFHAYDKLRQRWVVLRNVPMRSRQAWSVDLTNLQRRAEILHESLVPIVEIRTAPEESLVVSEYVEGQTLAEVLKRDPATLSRNDANFTRQIIRQVADALYALHARALVHGAVTPKNVCVTSNGLAVLVGFATQSELEPNARVVEADDRAGLADLIALCLSGGGSDALPNDTPNDLTRMVVALRESGAGGSNLREIARELTTDTTDIGTDKNTLQRPFVGRNSELRSLRQSFDSSQSGTPVLVVVHGDAGIGKTTLINHYLRSLGPDVLVLKSRCHPGDTASFNAFGNVIAGICATIGTHVSRDALLPRNVGALARLFPAFSSVIDMSQARLWDNADVQRIKDSAVLAFRDLLGRLSERRPTILWFDDFHWADNESQALLRALIEGTDSPSLLYIASCRTDRDLESFLADIPSEFLMIDQMKLGPLSRSESFELARELCPDNVSVVRLEPLIEQADGSPFLIEALVRDVPELQAGDAIIDLDGMIAARMKALTVPEREVMELVAVAEAPVDPALIGRLVGNVDAAQEALRWLEQQKLVRYAGEKTKEVYHSRIRDSVLRAMDRNTRRRLHLKYAETLAAIESDDYFARYWHSLQAGDVRAAFGHLLKAAQRAEEQLAFERAVELYERALEIRDEETLAVYPLLADALVHAGQPARAAEKYLMASSLVDDGELRYQHLTNAAFNFLVSGHFEQGIRLYRPVLKHYRILFPATQLRALRWYFRCVKALKRSGLQYSERREATISEHDLARLDVMDLVARGLFVVDNIRGVYFTALALLTSLKIGEPRRFLRSLDLADSTDTLARAGESVSGIGTRLLDAERVMARAKGDHEFLGRSLVNAAQKSLSRGEWRLALEQSREGLNNLHNVRIGSWEANTGTMIALRSMDELGELNELMRHSESFVAGSQSRGDFYGLATGKLYAAYAHLSRDDVAMARALADQVDGMWVGHHFHLQHFYIFRIKTLCDLYVGDFELAYGRLDAFAPLLRSSQFLAVPMVNLDFNLLTARMKLMHASEQFGVSCADEIQALDAQKLASSTALARVIEAAEFLRTNDRHTAIVCLDIARQAFEQLGMRLWHAYTTIRHGELRGGEADGTLVREAFARIAAQGVVRPEKWLQLHVPGFVSTR